MTLRKFAFQLACLVQLFAGQAIAQTCELNPELTRVVTRVETGGTLKLDDGSEVVLIGALPPVLIDDPNGATGAWPPAETSRKALEALVSGKAIDLAFSGRRLDRYGRLLAHVFVQHDQERLWVQGHLIEQGFSRAYGLPGNQACIDELLAHERLARTQHLGHWNSGVFQDRDGNGPRELSRFGDTFQTVEGRVARSTKIRGQYVLDFDPDGRSGFSIWLAPTKKGRRNAFQSSDLVGKRVRARGWIEVRRGPRLTLDDSRHIEILDETPEPPDADATQNANPSPPIPAVAR